LPRLTYNQALEQYGNDKPDIRFEMKIHDLTAVAKGKGFGSLIPLLSQAVYAQRAVRNIRANSWMN